MANSVDADQTPRSAASDLGLHCLIWVYTACHCPFYGTLGQHKRPGTVSINALERSALNALNGQHKRLEMVSINALEKSA